MAPRRPPARRARSPEASASSSADFADPYTLLVIADLLGVPEEDHPALLEMRLADAAGRRHRRGGQADDGEPAGVPPRGVHRLRRGPAAQPARRRADRLATATYPDGSTPEVIDVVRARRLPLRRGTGDHRSSPRPPLQAARRATRSPAAAARRARPHPELHRGDAAHREPDQEPLPHGARLDERRRRRRARGHHGHVARRRREPRPAPLRAPERVRRRPPERAPAPRVRAGHPHLPRRTPRPRRGPRRRSSGSSTA